MRLLVDMALGVGVAQWLRDSGHDAIHVGEVGMQRAADETIFAKAATERRIIVTTDLDFPEIVAISGERLVSVILIRMINPSVERVTGRLQPVLADAAGALEAGAVVVVEETRHRIRRLPIGAGD